MAERFFLDTNVFVYEFDPRDLRKQSVARTLIRSLLVDETGTISYQVVQEFLNAMSKFEAQARPIELRDHVTGVLWPMCKVLPSPMLYGHALTVREQTGWSFYDSLIVSAAIEAECSVLYSEDLQAGRVIEGLEIRNPFA